MKIIVMFLMLFMHEALQSDPGEGRIIGGSPAVIEDFPHQISLQYIGDHICGGSIIGQKFVLTAAHCTNEHNIHFLKIRYGTSIHDDGGVIIDVEEVLQHPNFNPVTYDFDVSVLKLKEKIVLSDTAKIIKMIDAAQNIPAGTSVQVSGWGYTKEGGSFSEHLREVTLPVVSQIECQRLYEPAPITDRMLCAGYVGLGGKDACQGDSGGPLIVDNKLVGVVSWGEGCARPEYPGIFANVSHMRLFIKDVSGI